MTNFNADPRVRDQEPNATGLGPNFPGSLSDLQRMVYRPSPEYLRYVLMAVSNDDGSPVAGGVEKLLASLLAGQDALRADVQAAQAAITAAALQPIRTPPVMHTVLGVPPGIVTGAAYADLDAIGTGAMSFTVPPSGVIQSAIYFDHDDEGLQVDLWLFRAEPPAQTDNGAFVLSDAALDTVIDVIQFVGFRDANTGQVSIQNGLNIAYKLDGEADRIYGQVQARGALNIAAGNLPAFRLSILPD